MRFLASALFMGLALAGPQLSARQSATAGIKSFSTEGDVCKTGRYAAVISTDGATATLIFDSFRASFKSGVVTTEAADVSCNITVTIDFPAKKCTSATIETIYRGYALTQGSATGELAATYSLAGGKLSGSSPPTKFGTGTDKDFLRDDVQKAEVTVSDNAKKSIKFIAQTRMRVIPGTSQATAAVYLDSIDFAVKDQKTC